MKILKSSNIVILIPFLFVLSVLSVHSSTWLKYQLRFAFFSLFLLQLNPSLKPLKPQFPISILIFFNTFMSNRKISLDEISPPIKLYDLPIFTPYFKTEIVNRFHFCLSTLTYFPAGPLTFFQLYLKRYTLVNPLAVLQLLSIFVLPRFSNLSQRIKFEKLQFF